MEQNCIVAFQYLYLWIHVQGYKNTGLSVPQEEMVIQITQYATKLGEHFLGRTPNNGFR